MKPSLPDWIPLGHVRRAHGIKGAIGIALSNPASNTLRPGMKIVLTHRHCEEAMPTKQSMDCHGAKAPRNDGYTITHVHAPHLISLEGITDRNAAEKLAGLQIWIRRSDLPLPEPGELYLADLMGFEAFDIHGQSLGRVTGFSDNGPQILVEIAGHMLIPMVKPLWVSVDEKAGKLVFDLPEGF